MGRRKQAGALMRNKSAVIGVICGICCALCVWIYVMQVDEQASAAQAEMLARYGGEHVEVCVAKRDIPAGSTIAESDVETKTWVASMLPQNAVMSRDEAVGKLAGSQIFAGEVINAGRFGFESAAIEVPDGMCAISVPARDVNAVGGALASGMKVDVYAMGASGASKLATSVTVLETGGAQAGSGSAWVTLALEPARVGEMVSAVETTELYFVLPSASVLAEGGGDAPRDAAEAGGFEEGAEGASGEIGLDEAQALLGDDAGAAARRLLADPGGSQDGASDALSTQGAAGGIGAAPTDGEAGASWM